MKTRAKVMKMHCYHPETEGYHQLLTTKILVAPQACQLANDVLMTIGSKFFLSDGLETNSSLLSVYRVTSVNII